MSNDYVPGGPVKPPSTMTPKVFVLATYAVMAFLAAFLTATMAPGAWGMALAGGRARRPHDLAPGHLGASQPGGTRAGLHES